MAGPTNNEQLMLEYINAARLDPFTEAGQYLTGVYPITSSNTDIQNNLTGWGVVGTTYYSAVVAMTPMQPLAWNENLATAARTHNGMMIAGDTQSHQVTSQGEADLGTRVTAAGYTWNAVGENIFSTVTSMIEAHAAFMIDWGPGVDGMQSPPGHRNNIMGVGAVPSLYREIGVGVTTANVTTANVGPLVVTEDFGNRTGLGPIILGVAYNDLDTDGFYTPGEGYGNLTVSVSGGGNVTSYASGGYTLETTVGNKTITFSGAGLSGNVTVMTTLAANQNVKLDIVSGNTLQTSTSVNVSGPVANILGLGMNGLTISATDATARDILGARGNDTITGGSSGDTLGGQLGNDVLTGGGGADFLDGGPGIDTAVYSGNRSSYTITHGGFVTISGPEGTDTLSQVEKAQFADMTVNLGEGATRTDMNLNNAADILWWNSSGGQVSCWYLNAGATALSSGVSVGPVISTSWHPIAGGDFNGDGQTDILWQSTSGQLGIWIMNGTTLNFGAMLINPGSSWTVKALGDFNGDGKADILWQKSDGTPCIYLMNGVMTLSTSNLASPGSSWQVIAAADFNGDGQSDILWQNTSTGQAAIWKMNGTTLSNGGAAGPNPGTTWHARGAGDFDGDGQADILWQNDSGQVSLWRMDGTTLLYAATVADPGSTWVVKGAGDFNADGLADILWQKTDGTPAVWVMNNTAMTSSTNLTSPGTTWQVLTQTA